MYLITRRFRRALSLLLAVLLANTSILSCSVTSYAAVRSKDDARYAYGGGTAEWDGASLTVTLEATDLWQAAYRALQEGSEVDPETAFMLAGVKGTDGKTFLNSSVPVYELEISDTIREELGEDAILRVFISPTEKPSDKSTAPTEDPADVDQIADIAAVEAAETEPFVSDVQISETEEEVIAEIIQDEANAESEDLESYVVVNSEGVVSYSDDNAEPEVISYGDGTYESEATENIDSEEDGIVSDQATEDDNPDDVIIEIVNDDVEDMSSDISDAVVTIEEAETDAIEEVVSATSDGQPAEQKTTAEELSESGTDIVMMNVEAYAAAPEEKGSGDLQEAEQSETNDSDTHQAEEISAPKTETEIQAETDLETEAFVIMNAGESSEETVEVIDAVYTDAGTDTDNDIDADVPQEQTYVAVGADGNPVKNFIQLRNPKKRRKNIPVKSRLPVWMLLLVMEALQLQKPIRQTKALQKTFRIRKSRLNFQQMK